MVYVANFVSDIVSVIDGNTLKISHISVGDGPWGIAVDEIDHIVYVAKPLSDTLSVIDGTNYRNIANIPIESPTSIAVDGMVVT